MADQNKADWINSRMDPMMLVITYLIALVLAIPTMGLSLLVWIVSYGVIHYNKGRQGFHGANYNQAMRELDAGKLPDLPSWANKPREVEVFFESIQRATKHKNIPSMYVKLQFSDEGIRRTYLGMAGSMERQGSPFTAQQNAVLNTIQEGWSRLADEHKRKFIALS